MAWGWRLDDNEERTHESLGHLPPAAYRKQQENSTLENYLINGEVDTNIWRSFFK